MFNTGRLLRKRIKTSACRWRSLSAGLIAAWVLGSMEVHAQTGGVLQFSTNNYAVLESDGFATVTVTRTGGTNSSATIEYATADGTALAGTDYLEKTGTLLFGVGETNKTFSVLILDNTVTNTPKTLNLRLFKPGGGAAVGLLTNATLTILDNDSASDTIAFQVSAYDVVENSGPALVTVTRSGARTRRVTADFLSVPGGTAVPGVDYLPVSGRLTFDPGQELAVILVTNLDNAILNQGTRTVFLQLTNPAPTNAAVLGMSTAVLNILENDFVDSSFLFTEANFTATESDGVATITVTRAGSTVGIATVDYLTSDGTAAAGLDYLATAGTLTFTNGQRFASFLVPLVNDTIVDLDETVNLTLTNASGGAVIAQTNALLTIRDNDSRFRFSTDRYVTNENSVAAIVTVIREGGVVGPAQVTLYTHDGVGLDAATSGLDYVGITGTNLLFADGQTFTNIAIALIDDYLVETNEYFNVTLTNAVGGVLGLFDTCQVLILDNDSNAGTFEFNAAAIQSSPEGGFGILVSVSRRGGASGAVSVSVISPSFQFEVCPGSTNANGFGLNQDFGFTATNLTWAANDGGDKLFYIVPIDDNYVELDETITLELANPTGGAVISGTLGSVQVNIEFDDEPPGAADRYFNMQSYLNPTPGANNLVYAIAVYTNGFYNGSAIIGGDFTSYDSTVRNRLARIGFDGTLDPSFDPGSGADGFVTALALQPDGKVIVGGGFTSINNISRNGIARLNADGSLDSTFDPGSGVDGLVNAVLLQLDGKIIIGGAFTTVNGVSRNNLARLNADGSVDSSFDPGSGTDAPVWSLATPPLTSGPVTISQTVSGSGSDTNVIVTGFNSGTIFLTADNGPIDDNYHIYYDGVLIYDSTFAGQQTITVPFGPGVATAISIVINEGNPTGTPIWSYSGTIVPNTGTTVQPIVIGGDFTMVNGVARSRIARLNSDGSLDSLFTPEAGPDNTVYALAVQADGRILAGGAFSSFNGQPWQGIARVTAGGLPDTFSFNPGSGFAGSVYSIAFQSDGKPIIVGDFSSFHGIPRTNIARLYLDGTLDTGFMDTYYNQRAGSDQFVWTAAVYPFATTNIVGTNATIVRTAADSVFLGGAFSMVGGGASPWDALPQSSIARLVGGDIQPALNMPGNVQFVSANYSIDENGGQLAVTVRRINGVVGNLRVNYTTVDGSAIAGRHYQQASGQLFWDHCDSTDKTIFIPILDNQLVDGNKSFTISLFDPFSTGIYSIGHPALGFQSQATLLIIDNDFDRGRIGFAAAAFYVNENGTNVVLTVTRSDGSNGSASVRYVSEAGSAKAPGDYNQVSGSLFFGPNETLKTFSVTIKNDSFKEPEEYFMARLIDDGSGTRFRDGATNAAVVIMDDDGGAGSLSFGTNEFVINEAAGVATITVRRTSGTASNLSVNYTTLNVYSNGWGYPNVDYLATSGTLTFLAGETTKTFPVTIVNDGLVEGNEYVLVALTNVQGGGTLGFQSNAVFKIVDDDGYGQLTFSQANYFLNETVPSITIDVQRVGGSSEEVAVDYSILAGTAEDGTDFVAGNGVLTFLDGETSKSFNVAVLNDDLLEAYETISLLLTNFQKAAPGAVTNATLTIVDDESLSAPAGSVNSGFAPGLNGSVSAIAIQEDMKIVVGGGFTSVDLTSRNRVARLNASGSLDISFDPGLGANGAVNAVALQRDQKILIAGSFSMVGLTNRAGIARLASDGLVDSSFNPGSGVDNPIHVLAVSPVDGRIVIGGAFVTFNGATRPYVAMLNTNGTLSTAFNPIPGPNAPVHAVAVQPDGKVLVGGEFTSFNGVACGHLVRLNADGTMDSSFNLAGGFNGTVLAIALQPDGRILVGGAFNSANGVVRNSAARLNADGTLDSTFLATEAGGNGFVGAIAVQPDGKIILGGDFTAFNGVTRYRITRLNADGSTDTTINFGTGANGLVAAVALQGDGQMVIGGGFTEVDGQPRPYLAQLIGGETAGAGTLEFSAPGFAVVETNALASITVRRTGGTGGQVTVIYSTSDATALEGQDYSGMSGILSFAPGETLQTIYIPILNDSVTEDPEYLNVTLSNPGGGATLGELVNATLTINSEDALISFSGANYLASEGSAGGFATITVVRAGGTDDPVTVDYATALGGTATVDSDYGAVSGTLTFAAGETVKIFTVPIFNDAFTETDETVHLTLFRATAPATLGLANATLTIVDNDFGAGTVGFASSAYVVNERDGSATITIARTNGSSGAVSVSFTTYGGTAIVGQDYLATNGVLTLAGGEVTKSFSIRILNDTLVEPAKTVGLRLSNPVNGATLGLANATLTISDDDFFAGTVDPDFNAAFGANGPVHTVSYANDRSLYVGGGFTAINGVNVNRIAKLTTNAVVDLVNFNPGTGANSNVLALTEYEGGEVLIAGDFTAVNGLARARVARLNPNGTVDGLFNPGTGPNSTVHAVGLVPLPVVQIADSSPPNRPSVTNLYFTGYPNGSVSVNFTGQTNQTNTVLIYAFGGTFTNTIGNLTFGQTASANLQYFIPGGSAATIGIVINGGLTNSNTWSYVGTIQAGTAGERKVLVGGAFTSVAGVSRSYIAQLNSDGTLDQTFGAANAGPNATVHALSRQTNGYVVIGGEFTSVGGTTLNRIARLAPNGNLDFFFFPGQGANATVRAIALQGDGKILIGGSFTLVDGASCNGIARLNADGSLDAAFDTGAGANDYVTSIAVQGDGTIVVVGAFTQFAGQPFNRIVRLNSDGSIDPTFNPGSGANALIHAVSAFPGNGLNRSMTVKLPGGNPLGVQPRIVGGKPGLISQYPYQVALIRIPYNPNDIYNQQFCGGTIINDRWIVTAAHCLETEMPFTIGVAVGVTDLRNPAPGRVYFADQIIIHPAYAALTYRNDIALIHLTESIDFSGATFPAQPIRMATPVDAAVGLTDPGVLTTITGWGNTSAGFFPNYPNILQVGTVPITATSLYLPGQITPEMIMAGYPNGGIDTCQGDSGGPLVVTNYLNNEIILAGVTSWGNGCAQAGYPGVYTRVSYFSSWVEQQMELADLATSRIAIGGEFTLFNQQVHNRIAVLGYGGEPDPLFNTSEAGNTVVNVIETYTNTALPALYGRMMVAGDFASVAGATVNRIARLNYNGSMDGSFNPGYGPNNAIRAMAIQGDGKVVVGGLFTSFNFTPRNYVARLNEDGSLDLTYGSGSGFNNAVYDLKLQADGRTVAGGLFTAVGGISRNFVARLNPDGTPDLTFNPGLGADGAVRAIAIQPDQRILIAGEFTSINGITRNRVARLNADGSLDTSFDPGAGPNGSVSSIEVQSDGYVVIGGSFTNVAGVARARVARLTPIGVIDNTFNPGVGAGDSVTCLAIQPDGRILVGGSFTTFGGITRNRLTRLNSDGSNDTSINLGSGANNFVAAIAIQNFDANIIVGGGFTVFDGQPRVGLARLFGGNNGGAGAIQFATNSYTVAENGTNAMITIERVGGSAGTVSALFSASGGTALAGSDYAPVLQQVTFAPGVTIQTVPVLVFDNFVTNVSRTVDLSLSSPAGGATLGAPTAATLTIEDNDSILSFSTDAYAVSEGAVAARVTVTRAGGLAGTVAVQFYSTNGTATPLLDYADTTGILTFGPGVVSQTFNVVVYDDLQIEGNETVMLGLFNPVGAASLGIDNATLTIVDNDFSPGIVSLSTNLFAVYENVGLAEVTLVRSNGSSGLVSVNYSTVSGSATAGADYISVSGVLVFDDGETNKTFTIPILPDMITEGTETIQVILSSPNGGATLGMNAALVTIIDDDGPGSLAFSSPAYSVNETNGLATITVLRLGGTVGNVAVTFVTGGGTAIPGQDYTSVSNVLVFTNGQTSRTISIPITNDALVEGDETVTLLLLNPTGGAVIGSPATATLTIVDNEVSLTFTASDYTVTESNILASLAVARTGNTNVAVSVNYFTTDGTAVAGADYLATNGVVSFAPGETNQTLTVRILDDTLVEPAEYLNVTLANPTGGATLGAQPAARLTILDNDVSFSFSAPNYVVTEGFGTNFLGTNAVITVVRFGDTNSLVSVDWLITGGTASNILDYYDLNAGHTLTFGPGQTTNTFEILVLEDTLVEGIETVDFGLANPSPGAVLGSQPTATLFIVDNDTSFSFSATNYVVNEKATNAVITITRSGVSTGVVSVVFSTGNGTAVAGPDYGNVSTLLTWQPNDLTSRTVLVPVFDDGIIEGSETVILTLINPTGGAFVDRGLATLTIIDNAGSIAFSSASFTASEDTGNAIITLTRSGGSNGVVTVDVVATSGTAVSGVDFFAPTSTVAFASGEVVKTVGIPLMDDLLVEGSETVNLALGNPSGGALVGNPNRGVLTILDNEANVVAAGSALVSDPNGNGLIDPSERVTLMLALRNAGTVPITNLVATLLSGNGIASPTGPQNYGTLAENGPSVSRSYTFTATGTTGSVITATLQFLIGPNTNFATFSYVLGTGTNIIAVEDAITINDSGSASPYPATLTVSGLTGAVTKVTVTLVGLSHTYPEDMDMVLVSPSGQTVMLMSDVGGGSGITNVTLTFDDAALSSLSTSKITNGTYRPSNIGPADAAFPAPAPSSPYGTSLSAFNGVNPNGVWSLYVVDDNPYDGGRIVGGWRLAISTTALVGSSADLAVTILSSTNQVMPNELLTYTVNVTNYGPSSVSGVYVTNHLPAGVTLVTNMSTSGSYTLAGNLLVYSLPNLAMDAGARMTLVMNPTNSGPIVLAARVTAFESDGNPNNNASTNVVLVGLPTPPRLSAVAFDLGQPMVWLKGQLGQTYVIEASSNLRDWVPVSTNVLTGENIHFVDPEAAQYPQRFYRAIRRR